jgi:putative flippase GtrA
MATLARQFFHYALAGGIAWVVDFSVLFVLTEYGGLHYLVSASAGFMCGLLVIYAISTRWIFDERALNDRRVEFAAFALIGLAGLALNNLVMFVLTDGLGLYYLASKLVAAAVVLIFNFGTRRRFLFSRRRNAS